MTVEVQKVVSELREATLALERIVETKSSLNVNELYLARRALFFARATEAGILARTGERRGESVIRKTAP